MNSNLFTLYPNKIKFMLCTLCRLVLAISKSWFWSVLKKNRWKSCSSISWMQGARIRSRYASIHPWANWLAGGRAHLLFYAFSCKNISIHLPRLPGWLYNHIWSTKGIIEVSHAHTHDHRCISQGALKIDNPTKGCNRLKRKISSDLLYFLQGFWLLLRHCYS